MSRNAKLGVGAVVVVLALAAIGWIAHAHIESAKLEARRSVSAANLHCWGTTIRLFVDRHASYPSSLTILYEEGLIEDCPEPTDPCDESPPPPDEDGRRWSYVYVGKLPADIPEWTIIAYTRPGVQPDQRLVLYADEGRSVEWVTEEDLHAAIGE